MQRRWKCVLNCLSMRLYVVSVGGVEVSSKRVNLLILGRLALVPPDTTKEDPPLEARPQPSSHLFYPALVHKGLAPALRARLNPLPWLASRAVPAAPC